MSNDFTRRQLCVFAMLTFLMVPTKAADESLPIEVWKSPNCGFCKAWIAHLKKNGFSFRLPTVATMGSVNAWAYHQSMARVIQHR